jgi:uncharacterized membrane protein YphA (DoxX/SURF4 family)
MPLSYGPGLALLRIGVGLYFLSAAVGKLTTGWLASPDQLLTVLTGPQGSLTRGAAEGVYRPFLEGVVVPHAGLFAQLIPLGELAVGVSLSLGLLTRLGGLGGAWLSLNYMLMKGLLNSNGSIDRLFLLAEVVFVLAAAGLVWGLDGKLREMFATHPFTRWGAGLAPPVLARSKPGRGF